jgi:hypothetical protein
MAQPQTAFLSWFHGKGAPWTVGARFFLKKGSPNRILAGRANGLHPFFLNGIFRIKMDNDALRLPASFQNEDFDTHFKVFHELMSNKVFEILLVASPYDAYVLEEDGSLASKIINEYRGLNLSRPPRITQAATAARPWICSPRRHSIW